MTTHRLPAVSVVTAAAALILMVTMGIRQSTGLFVSPINTSTGLGLTAISLAMAIAQFTWGLAQPIAGAIADRWGPGRVLAGGIVVLAAGSALVPLMDSTWGLVFTLGLLAAVGSGASSFSVLIGAASQWLPAEQRGMASGIINAGGSLGQVIFAPLTQKLITMFGWMGAMWTLAALSLAALPFVRILRRRDVHATPIPIDTHAGHATQRSGVDKASTASSTIVASSAATAAAAPSASAAASAAPASPTATAPAAIPAPVGLRQTVRQAISDRSYLLLHAGFFTCGFHIAFLVTHLPGEVELCGLTASVASWSLAIIGAANVVGSLLAGAALGWVRGKYLLFWMYASRAVLILLYLMAPKTAMTFYLFAAGLGLTWLATVPPTAGVIGKLFGARYLATLFGLTLLSHQIGGFFGAWLGGVAMTELGNYNWMWYADIVLAAAAALVNLPIREAPVRVPAARAQAA